MKLRVEEKFGVIVSIKNESSDDLEDYLAEKRYVFFQQRFLKDHVEFFFGEASCLESVNRIMNDFFAHNKIDQ